MVGFNREVRMSEVDKKWPFFKANTRKHFVQEMPKKCSLLSIERMEGGGKVKINGQLIAGEIAVSPD